MELTVDIRDDATGADVEKAVSRSFGTTALSVAGVPLTAVGRIAEHLAQGAVLVNSDAALPRDNQTQVRQETDQPILSLVVHTGAGAGSVFPLQRGNYRIGRSEADIVIPDPQMSRDHALLAVSETTVTITDLGSANGTLVDGRSRAESVISTDSCIRCGDSFMTICPGDPALSPHKLEDAGMSVAEPLPVAAFQQQGSRAILLGTAIAPLVIGVGLALITGLWMFLAFSAMSGIAVLIPFLSGRRQRKEFSAALQAAVQQDQNRRRQAAPSAVELLAPNVPEHHERPASGHCPGIWLRLGLGEQVANIRLEPAVDHGRPPSAGLLPVTLDPGTPLTTVSGPEALRAAFLRSVLLQLGHIPRAACSAVVVHADPDQLPLAARFLRNVQLSSSPARTRALLDEGESAEICHRVLLLAQGGEAAGELLERAMSGAWQVIQLVPPQAKTASHHLDLGDYASIFTHATQTCAMIPDLVSVRVFEGAARAGNPAMNPTGPQSGIPARCSLHEVLALSPAAISERWDNGRSAHGLRVPLGIAGDGVQWLDLEGDGPHVLIAGTTGSGKSELLRGLSIALAASYSPERLNFLFVDFKGGSGLAPLTGLPHCVGILTDLSSEELDRFLASLRAEVRRREQLLAAAGAADLAGYRKMMPPAGDVPLPQLVMVIDEFRMLVEDAPAALGELMRIATLGRSLGLHLVMATQRPQGAVTADIRANVTTSIALRVQSDVESVDVINSRFAACIDVETPGRAFLCRGADHPREFQAASLATQHLAGRPAAIAYLALDVAGRKPGNLVEAPDNGTSATASLVGVVSLLWEDRRGTLPRGPVAASLPKELAYPRLQQEQSPPAADLTDAGVEKNTDGAYVALGILDKPEEQRLAPFRWSPSAHSHLALISSPAVGGHNALLVLAVEQLLRHSAETHLYLLDGLGLFNSFAAVGRIGAKAGAHELRRGVRILERIHEEMAARLSNPDSRIAPQLVLIVSGWGAWVSALRSGPLMWAEDLVQDIVRDGGPANITVIVAGERELVTSRIFSGIPNRIFCPAGATEESRIAWPPMPRTNAVAGRAVAFGPAALGGPSVCQLYTSGSGTAPDAASCRLPVVPPFRVDPLPAVLGAEFLPKLAALRDLRPSGGDLGGTKRLGGRKLVLGIGGDEQALVTTPFPAGNVLAVLGRAGSGRSSAARSLVMANPQVDWIFPSPHEDPEAYWAAVQASALNRTIDSTGACMVDDADRLPTMTNQQLLDLNSRGVALVFTATFSPALVQRVPVALAARTCGAGLLLAPRSSSDGDMFGIRFEIESSPPPGRAVLVADGQSTAVQLPHLPQRTTPSGRRRGVPAATASAVQRQCGTRTPRPGG